LSLPRMTSAFLADVVVMAVVKLGLERLAAVNLLRCS